MNDLVTRARNHYYNLDNMGLTTDLIYKLADSLEATEAAGDVLGRSLNDMTSRVIAAEARAEKAERYLRIWVDDHYATTHAPDEDCGWSLPVESKKLLDKTQNPDSAKHE